MHRYRPTESMLSGRIFNEPFEKYSSEKMNDVQRVGQLYGSGVDSNLILTRTSIHKPKAEALMRTTSRLSKAPGMVDNKHPKQKHHIEPYQVPRMRGEKAVHLSEAKPGGRFHIDPGLPNPYHALFLVRIFVFCTFR